MPDPSPASSLRVARVILLKCQSAVGTPLLSELHWPTGSLRSRPRLLPLTSSSDALPDLHSRPPASLLFLKKHCPLSLLYPEGMLTPREPAALLHYALVFFSQPLLALPVQPPHLGHPIFTILYSVLTGWNYLDASLLYKNVSSTRAGLLCMADHRIPVPRTVLAHRRHCTEYIFVGREFNCSSDRIRKLTLPCAVSNPLLFSPMTFTAALGVEALLSSF